MSKNRARLIYDLPPRFDHVVTEVHVFEPARIKTLIKTTHTLPCLPPEGETCASGIIDGLGAIVIHVQVPVGAVPRISAPDLVQKKKFGHRTAQGGETPHHVSLL